MRSRRSSRILITGATGFLGSHLAVELLHKGYAVLVLARPLKNTAAKARVHRLLDWFGVEQKDRRGIEVIEGNLESPSLGLDARRFADLAEGVDEIIHCASSTSFSERRRASVEEANVTNLENLLLFAARSRCSFFHYLSTAYVAGKQKGSCREEIVETREFTNVYEETKHIAERLASRKCREEGIRLVIYRPSIVYGNSRNGRTFRFNAFYYPLRTLVFLKDAFEKDIRENGGKRARALGISIGHNGHLHLPIRMEALDTGGINLIPVDFFIGAFLSIMENALEGGIFHIVNPRLKPVQELTAYAERFLGVKGIRVVPAGTFEKSPMNGLEILFDQCVEAYRPYMKDERRFDSARTGPILRRTGIECPDLDYPVFSRCFRYALETDWGKNLQSGVLPTKSTQGPKNEDLKSSCASW